jgi:hypothetical protein
MAEAPGIEGAIQSLRAQLGGGSGAGATGVVGTPYTATPPWMQSGVDLRKPLAMPDAGGASPDWNPNAGNPNAAAPAGNRLAELLKARLANLGGGGLGGGLGGLNQQYA